jgi:hypothetical protein
MAKTTLQNTFGNIVPGKSLASWPNDPGVAAPVVADAGPKDLSRSIIATLAPTGSYPILAVGDFVYIKAITTPNLTGAAPAMATYSAKPSIRIKPYNGPEMVVDRVGQSFRFTRAFSNLQVSYPAASITAGLIISVELIIGFGGFDEPAPHRVSPFFSERTITRPANAIAYAAGQYVGNTADMGGKCLAFLDTFRLGSRYSRITRAMIRKNSATITNAVFSLYFFQVPPTTSCADQVAFAMTPSDDNPQMGRIQFPAFITGGAGSTMSFCDLAGIDFHLRQLDGNFTESAVYGALVADAAYIPTASEPFIVSIWGEQLG